MKSSLERAFPTAAAACAAFVLLLTGGRATAQAQTSVSLGFVSHGSFFSTETHQAKPIDPQVFVESTAALQGTGPQNIVHVAGFSPAPLAGDPSSPIFAANGLPLGISLGEWLGARGTVTITPGTRGAAVTSTFTGLVPGGLYSLFKVTFSSKGNSFDPLDGDGKASSFSAGSDGSGSISTVAPFVLTHENAVLLVYHSDGSTHGMARGLPGITAHHQLIARVP